MPKRVANGLTLLSAVVCVLSLLLMGRSFFRTDQVTFPIGPKNVGGVISFDGQLWLWYERDSRPFDYTSYDAKEWRSIVLNFFWRGLTGIRWLGIGWGTFNRARLVILPLWLLPLLTAIGPVRWWRKRRREAGRGFAVETAHPGAG